jgi:hypothetical protein
LRGVVWVGGFDGDLGCRGLGIVVYGVGMVVVGSRVGRGSRVCFELCVECKVGVGWW